MLQKSHVKYQLYYEHEKDGEWYYLIEYTAGITNFYIQKADYGDFMFMFELMNDTIFDEKDMINRNKGLYQSCYNELHCKGEEK